MESKRIPNAFPQKNSFDTKVESFYRRTIMVLEEVLCEAIDTHHEKIPMVIEVK